MYAITSEGRENKEDLNHADQEQESNRNLIGMRTTYLAGTRRSKGRGKADCSRNAQTQNIENMLYD